MAGALLKVMRRSSASSEECDHRMARLAVELFLLVCRSLPVPLISQHLISLCWCLSNGSLGDIAFTSRVCADICSLASASCPHGSVLTAMLEDPWLNSFLKEDPKLQPRTFESQTRRSSVKDVFVASLCRIAQRRLLHAVCVLTAQANESKSLFIALASTFKFQSFS